MAARHEPPPQNPSSLWPWAGLPGRRRRIRPSKSTPTGLGHRVTRRELEWQLEQMAIPKAARDRVGGEVSPQGRFSMREGETFIRRVLAGKPVDPAQAMELAEAGVEAGQWWVANHGADPYPEWRATWIDLMRRIAFQLTVTGRPLAAASAKPVHRGKPPS